MSDSEQNDVLNLINQMGVKNPKMQMLAQLMQQNQENTGSAGEDQEFRIRKLIFHIKKQATLLKKLEKSNQDMKKKIKYLVDNLNYRIQINDILAGAVGACSECWGEDPGCRKCHGNGHPGTMGIDHESFKSIVVPAVKAMGLQEKSNENKTN